MDQGLSENQLSSGLVKDTAHQVCRTVQENSGCLCGKTMVGIKKMKE